MAKIPQGILGGVSGKIGGVVGSSWKGINVIKTKPLSVANPQSAGQVAQRTKFSNTVAFAVAILSTVIKPLWDRFASRESGYNAFIKQNIDLFTGEYPSTPADLVISNGKMSATVIDYASQNISGAGQVTWTDDSGEGYKLASDTLYLVIENEDDGIIEGFDTGVLRSAEVANFNLAGTVTSGNTYNAYAAFRRADGTVVSNTSTDYRASSA